MNKIMAIAALATSLIMFGSVPAMASVNIISGNSVATGANVVKITPSMYRTYQPPAITTSVVPKLTVTVPTVGSSVISLKGLLNNYVSSVNGVVQQTPIPVAVVPSTLDMATSVTADEQEMIDLINQDRINHGLPALKVDLRLVSVARDKSEDIKANNYFTHVSPNFGYTASLFSQMGLNVNYWAENVGAQMTVKAAG